MHNSTDGSECLLWGRNENSRLWHIAARYVSLPDRPKADLHKYNHKDALTVALENYFLAPFTAALSVAPALNAGALEALIFIAAPMDGL
jgi:hypothetical protein